MQTTNNNWKLEIILVISSRTFSGLPPPLKKNFVHHYTTILFITIITIHSNIKPSSNLFQQWNSSHNSMVSSSDCALLTNLKDDPCTTLTSIIYKISCTIRHYATWPKNNTTNRNDSTVHNGSHRILPCIYRQTRTETRTWHKINASIQVPYIVKIRKKKKDHSVVHEIATAPRSNDTVIMKGLYI